MRLITPRNPRITRTETTMQTRQETVVVATTGEHVASQVGVETHREAAIMETTTLNSTPQVLETCLTGWRTCQTSFLC